MSQVPNWKRRSRVRLTRRNSVNPNPKLLDILCNARRQVRHPGLADTVTVAIPAMRQTGHAADVDNAAPGGVQRCHGLDLCPGAVEDAVQVYTNDAGPHFVRLFEDRGGGAGADGLGDSGCVAGAVELVVLW